jgi:hypothetical protein
VLAGLCGLAGALLFFAGDMLLYGHLGAGNMFAGGALTTVQQSSTQRLFAGGLLGPIAACLCIVGFWHVYRNVRPDTKALGRLMFAAFFVMMVVGSAVHAVWVAKGIGMKYCTDPHSGCAPVLELAKRYWDLLYTMSATPGYIGTALLGYLVVSGKTIYPRWAILANPAIILLIFSLGATHIPSPIGAVLVGGTTNLSILTFFAVSLVLTMRRNHDKDVYHPDAPPSQGALGSSTTEHKKALISLSPGDTRHIARGRSSL